jgi:hypothetical protein
LVMICSIPRIGSRKGVGQKNQESERRKDRPSDRWDPPVRTDEKYGQKRSLL